MASDHAIALERLTKLYRGGRGVRDVDLRVGHVAVAELRARGQVLKLARVEISPGFVIPVALGLLGYYATIYYVCKGDVAAGAQWNSLMGVSGMVMGLADIPFAAWLARRHGKRNALATVLVLAICAFIGDWFFYNPNLPWLQLLASGCVAFTGAGFWTIYGSAMADIIDHDELETGQRREGNRAPG